MTFQTPPVQAMQSLNPQDYRYVVIVAISRHYENLREFHESVIEYLQRFDAPVLFVSGASNPGDGDLIQRWCQRFNYPCLVMPADWNAHPHAAVYVRNEEMNKIATHVLAFDNDHFREVTKMIELAVATQRQVTIIHITPPDTP